jgi:hypothetical protein
MAKGKFTSTGGAQIINLPFQPDFIEMWNYTASAAFTDHRVLSAVWDVNMGQGFALTTVKNTTMQTDSVIVNGFSTFSAGQMLQYGPTKTVTDITKAAAAQVTVTAHGLTSGDVVILTGLYQSTTTGMPQLNGIPFTVTVVDANNFTIPWNTNQSNYTVISGAATGTPRMKKVLYPYLYFPGTTFISAITGPNGSSIPTGTIQIDTTDAHNFVVGQEVAFRIPSEWGSVELNSLPNIPIPGSPIYGYVVSVTSYNRVIVSTPYAASFTAFNSNQLVANVPGLSYPQIVAVGDVNTGGVQLSSGSALYPPPYFIPIGTTRVNTINGPAIQGAFVNNTSQGFIIGAGVNVTDAAAVLVGAAENVIYWRAYLHDMSLPS